MALWFQPCCGSTGSAARQPATARPLIVMRVTDRSVRTRWRGRLLGPLHRPRVVRPAARRCSSWAGWEQAVSAIRLTPGCMTLLARWCRLTECGVRRSPTTGPPRRVRPRSPRGPNGGSPIPPERAGVVPVPGRISRPWHGAMLPGRRTPPPRPAARAGPGETGSRATSVVPGARCGSGTRPLPPWDSPHCWPPPIRQRRPRGPSRPQPAAGRPERRLSRSRQ